MERPSISEGQIYCTLKDFKRAICFCIAVLLDLLLVNVKYVSLLQFKAHKHIIKL